MFENIEWKVFICPFSGTKDYGFLNVLANDKLVLEIKGYIYE
jgi:hypothetical protein